MRTRNSIRFTSNRLILIFFEKFEKFGQRIFNFFFDFFSNFHDSVRSNRTIATYPNKPLDSMDFNAKEALY